MPPSFARPRDAWLFWIVAVLALAAGLGLRDPSPPDEPRFVLAARHMVESGDWLFPRRGGELYAHKPPPFMWLQAAAFELVRHWRVAFLLPSLLAALGTLWLVRDAAARWWHPRLAAYAGFALLASLQFGLQAKRGQIDMVLVFWTTLAVWGLLRHVLRGPDWTALALGGFAAGVGTVTKGVGFLPLLVLLPGLLAMRRIRPRPPWLAADRRWTLLPLGFLAGVGVWLVPMLATVLASDDPALHRYAQELLFRQTGTRYAAAWHHVQPPWYYAQVIATLWLPGALLLPWLLPAWRRRWRRGDARTIALLGWALLVLLFFSASPGKREVYIFPALPLLCVAAAPLLPGLLRRPAVRRVLLGYVLALSALAFGLAVSGLSGAQWAPRVAGSRGMAPADLHSMLLWLLALGVGGAAVALAGWRTARAGAAVVAFGVLLWLGYGFGLAPALDASSSGRALMQRVDARLGPDGELALVAWSEQHLLQAVRPAVEFGIERTPDEQWRAAARWLGADPVHRWVLAPTAALTPCLDPAATVALGRANRRDWVLAPGTAWRPGCKPAERETTAPAPPE